MGQKVHPVGYRLGFTKTWNAKWFAEAKNYRILLKEDIAIRTTIRGRLRDAAIARIDIERSTNQVTVTIQTAKPGVVIGKGGPKVEELRQALGKATGKAVKVNIFEIRYPELDANLIAENVGHQLERRVSFRKVLKQSVSRSMKAGAKGVRVAVAGRLGGAEMSRREWEREGRVPLHTLRAYSEFGRAIAKTTFGTIGVKAWIRVFPDKPVTKKPAEVRMGSGKGAPDHWVAVVKPGRILFELAGVDPGLAKEAMRLASYKLPIRTKFLVREGTEGESSATEGHAAAV